MLKDLPPELRDLASIQRGIITRQQAQAAGLSRDAIASRIASGRWQRIHVGVYAVFSGRLDRQATLWAAVLRAEPVAALSHQTAAELDRLVDIPAPVSHVTIQSTRRVDPIEGIVLHAKVDWQRAVHPSRLPPRTRLEETVLDLVSESDTVWEAVGWVTRALGRRLTTGPTACRPDCARPRSSVTASARPCLVAMQLAGVLRLRGWRGTVRPCSPGCAVSQGRQHDPRGSSGS